MLARSITLLVLPMFLATTNMIKVFFKWLFTGNDVSREEVERAIIEVKSAEELDL